MKTPRQRIENTYNAKSNYRQRTWNYVEEYPGELVGAPDPDAYQRMKAIKDALPARHECYVRQRITHRGKGKATVSRRSAPRGCK